MNIRFNGKATVITGATGAIGYACAETLLQSGAQVALLGRHADKLAVAEKFKKLSQPGDIANAVCFLASEAAQMITGQVLAVGGGGSLVGVYQ